MFFRKKGNFEKMQESHVTVKENLASAKALLSYVDELPEIKNAIEEVIDLLKYKVGPANVKEANKIDEKIANKLGDLKILLAKNNKDSSDKAKEILRQIKIDIAERQIYSK